MFEAVLNGLAAVAAWPAIGYLFLGVLLGLWFGAVPGLSGLVGMAILVPFTFAMEPAPALAFLLGAFAVTTTSDTIASVLLGIPGTAASQATILDGYPMAVKGEASRAFGAAFTVSAIGGLLGAVVLGLSIPLVQPLILSFTQAEFFMLSLLALAMVGSLSGNSVLLGLIVALVGLGLSYVGYSENGALPRYWLGATYLLEGLPLIPVVLGLFALPELIDLAARGGTLSSVPRERVSSGIATGITDAFRNWWLVLRSTAIGAYVGMLPGLGGSIVDWVAYGHAVQSSKNNEGFGKGDVRGVIAPETANNAMKGGALIPTIAFGIPGSAAMAILMSALMIQGMTPGPEMLTTRLDFTFSLVWMLAIANVAGALVLMLLARYIARVTFISGHLLVPVIVLFVFMGAWLANSSIGDWVVLLAFGCVGYLMKRGGVPRPPLVLGFVIGPIMENALFITTSVHDGLEWLARPICLVIGALIVGSIVFAARRRRSLRAENAAGAPRATPEGAPQGVQTDEKRVANLRGIPSQEPTDPTMALLATGFLLAVAVYGLAPTFSWPTDVGQFPMLTFIPAIGLCLAALWYSVREFRQARAAGRDIFPGREALGDAGRLYLWWLCMLAATVLAGQLIALPVFAALYLKLRGGCAWWTALVYAAGAWSFLYLVFDRVVAVLWYPSLLFH